MFCTIINDCNSNNDFGRQASRIFNLFGNIPVVTVGIGFGGTYEAAGNLVDILDASAGQKGLVLVNSAPRHGQGKKWPNGTPFGYFYHGDTLIISTVDGYCLSLAKKLGLIKKLFVTDTPTVVDEMIKQSKLDKELRDLIVKTQFRSYEYSPRVAKWLFEEVSIPHEVYPLTDIAEITKTVWLVDGFGNCKTTMMPEDIEFKAGKTIATKFGELVAYDRLKDVPNGQPGLVIGSSGYKLQRFIEIVMQGSSAAARFKIKAGSDIF